MATILFSVFFPRFSPLFLPLSRVSALDATRAAHFLHTHTHTHTQAAAAHKTRSPALPDSDSATAALMNPPSLLCSVRSLPAPRRLVRSGLQASAATAAAAPLSLNSVKRLVSFPLRLLPRQPLADPAPMIFGSMTISKSAFLFYCLPSFTDTEPETMFQAPQQHRRNQQNALFRRRFYLATRYRT